jgi:5-methylcytosine-specific restriction endonuclease McrA
MAKIDTLLADFNHRCVYCGTVVSKAADDRMATADHMIPLSRNGVKAKVGQTKSAR